MDCPCSQRVYALQRQGARGSCGTAWRGLASTLPPPTRLPQTGVYVAGTELEGLHREVLVRAVKLLEQQGKAKLFKGAAGDDEGVKFFTNA